MEPGPDTRFRLKITNQYELGRRHRVVVQDRSVAIGH